MCNLYSLTKGQQAIRELARAMSDRTGNMPPLPGIYPDYRAPIVRNQLDGRVAATFIAGRGGVAGDVRRHAAVLAALAPDVIMAQHLDRDAVAAGEPHLLSRDEWTGGNV